MGASANLTLALTSCNELPISLTSIGFAGAGQPFAVSNAPQLPVTLTRDAPLQLTVGFAPVIESPAADTLQLTADGAAPVEVSLTGAGVVPVACIALSDAPEVSINSYDFQNVFTDSTYTENFVVVNCGSGVLTLTAADFSDASSATITLTAGLDTTPINLNPGDTTEFSLTFAPIVTGPVSGDFAVQTNGGEALLELTGAGIAAADVCVNYRLSPDMGDFDDAMDFGGVYTGNPPVAITLLVENCGSESFMLNPPALSPQTDPQFVVSDSVFPGDPGTPIEAGQTATITVAFAPDSADAFTGTLPLAFDIRNLDKEIAISGMGEAAENRQLSIASSAWDQANDRLDFGQAQIGSETTVSVYVVNTGNVDTTVSNVANIGGDAAFVPLAEDLPRTLIPGARHEFSVSVTLTGEGSSSAVMRVETQDSYTRSFGVAVQGVWAQVAITGERWNADTQTLEFGNVLVNYTVTTVLTVTNTGVAPIIFDGLGSGSGMFAGADGSTFANEPLAPGASQTIVCELTRSSAGAVSSVIDFNEIGGMRWFVDWTATGLAGNYAIVFARASAPETILANGFYNAGVFF